MTLPLSELDHRVQAGLTSREADPLAFFHHGVERAREAAALLIGDDPIDELYARACNKGLKTTMSAALVVAMLQKRSELDGVPLPQWRGPVTGLALSLDYNQQKLSVQQAILKVLGRWPHHAKWKGDDILSSLRIQPVGGNDDESTWSTLTFMSEENKRAGVGARADVVWADEPPVEEIWREVRKAAHAGRRMVRIISATPTIRRQWAWLKDEFGDTPRSCIRRIGHKAEARWSLHEVAAWVLSDAEKAALLELYANDPLERSDRKARSHGDYVDASGSCPFDIETLELMLEQCVTPAYKTWNVREESDDGAPTVRSVPTEVYEQPMPGQSYYMTIDPSSGIDDSRHDPFEMEISRVGTGDLVHRCGGYLTGRLVGILGAGLCRQYNNAIADPEVNDRWGVNVVEGFYAADYANFARESRELTPGKFSNEIGFHNTQRTRPLIIGAIQEWLESWRAGIRYGKCPSRFIINTLLDCILDEKGKIVAAPGLHDEALICWGQSLRRSVTRIGREMPELNRRVKTPEDRLAALISGEVEEDDDSQLGPFGQVARTARRRPNA